LHGLDVFKILSDAVNTYFVSHRGTISITHIEGLVLVAKVAWLVVIPQWRVRVFFFILYFWVVALEMFFHQISANQHYITMVAAVGYFPFPEFIACIAHFRRFADLISEYCF